MKIRCPRCQEESSDESWDEITDSHFNIGETDIAEEIEDLESGAYYYVCPKCYEEIDGSIFLEEEN